MMLAIMLLIYMTNLIQAGVPTPYYRMTVDPVVSDLANKCGIPTDSVPAISPNQYNSLVSLVRDITTFLIVNYIPIVEIIIIIW